MIKDDSFVRQISHADYTEDSVSFVIDFSVVDALGQLSLLLILVSVFQVTV